MTKENLKKIMGSNIRDARIERGLSIDELAELLKLTPGFVGLIERGQRGVTAYTLYKLSVVFDTNPNSFFIHPKDIISNEESNLSSNMYKKINSMIYDLDSSELDFVVSVIKSLRTLRNSASENELFEDAEDEI